MLLNVDELEIINKSIPKAEGKITRKQAKEAAKKHYPDLPPNGRWVTIRGNHVYIVDGKVVAGFLPWMSKKGEIKPKKATKAHLKAFQEHVDKKKAKEEASKKEEPALVVEAPKKTSEEKPKKNSRKQKFHILTTDVFNGKSRWEEAEGERFRHNGHDFFIHTRWNPHYPNEREWRITHGKTGLAVISGAGTKQDAKDRFNYLMENTPKEKFEQTVQRYLDQNGISPSYAQEEKPKKTKKTTTEKKAEEPALVVETPKKTTSKTSAKKAEKPASEEKPKVDKKSVTEKPEKTVETPAPKEEPKKPAKKMSRKEVIHELQDVFGLKDLAPNVAERRVFAKLRQYGLMEKCEKCGGTGETPAGLLCPKCYGEGVQYPKLTAELVERAKEKVAEQKGASAPKKEAEPEQKVSEQKDASAPKKETESKQKVEKITATNAKKLMTRKVPVKYRDALLDTLQHEEQGFSHNWLKRYEDGEVYESKYKMTGKLYKKHEVEEAIQKYMNDPKFREEVHARVDSKEKAEKDAFESDVKEFMDELRKHHLNDSSIEFEVSRRLMDEQERERQKAPKKEEPKQTGGLDDIFGDVEDLDAFFNDLMNGKPSEEDKKWQKRKEEIRRQVVQEAEERLKEYEDLLRERLTQFHEAKKKKNYKNRYQKMTDDQIRHEMNKIARDYSLPYGQRLLKRYMIAKQTGREDWKM